MVFLQKPVFVERNSYAIVTVSVIRYGHKSSTKNFPKVPQKVATAVLFLKVMLSKIAQKVTLNLNYF